MVLIVNMKILFDQFDQSSKYISGPMCGAYHLTTHISYTKAICIDIYDVIMFIFNKPIFVFLL